MNTTTGLLHKTGKLLQSPPGVALVLLCVAVMVPMATMQNARASVTAVDAARQMLSKQNYKAAISKLNGVLEDSPDNGEARFLKGLALAQSGQGDAALKLFESLVEDYPRMTQAWNNLGVLRARTGNLVGARKALEKAISLEPEHVAARQNLGDVYVALARQSYVQARELAPDNRVVDAKSRVLGYLMSSKSLADVKAIAAGTTKSPPAEKQRVRVASVGVPEIVVNQTTANDTNSGQSRQEAVVNALHDWAKAWSSQNLQDYFSAYSPQFDPNGTRTIQQWRALRVRRVSRPDWIKIRLSDVDVTLTGSDKATVHFEQAYRSNSYHDSVRKTITMEHGSKGWLITTESG